VVHRAGDGDQLVLQAALAQPAQPLDRGVDDRDVALVDQDQIEDVGREVLQPAPVALAELLDVGHDDVRASAS
jgi:hypothetical protein